MIVTLKLKKKINGYVNLKELSKINNVFPSKNFVSNILLLYKDRLIKVGDIFSVSIKKKSTKQNEIIIKSSCSFFNFLGYGWQSDKLVICGNVGSHLGAEMTSGRIKVEGNCENFVGAGMSGGAIHINGDAGDFMGSNIHGASLGMNGGEIFVKGNVGNFLARFMRRGMIIINGNVKDYCCLSMIAGTVIISKKIGKFFGFFMKRGTLILLEKPKFMNQNFLMNGSQEINFFGLVKSHLRDKLQINFLEEKNNIFLRQIGDRNNLGLAEILIRKN